MRNKKVKIAVVACGLLVMTFQAKAQEKEPPSPEKVIERLDTDKDGKLSLEEAKQAKRGKLAEHFDKIDTDKDGYISNAELTAMNEKRKGKKKKKD